METRTVILAVHGLVALGLVGVGTVSLLGGEPAGFLLRLVMAALVFALGYVLYRRR